MLIEGPSTSPDDDVLLEIREVRDPPVNSQHVDLYPRVAFSSNGARAVQLARQAQTSPTNDAYAGWAEIASHSFKVRHRTGFQEGMDAGRISKRLGDGRFDATDFVVAAKQSGAILAHTHARTPTIEVQ